MSIAELHPEELFDKLVRGSLSVNERERLAQHLQGCAVCRFDYEARLDFQDETRSTLQRVAPDLPLQPVRSRPVPVIRRRRSRILVWGIAAALLVGVSGAFAAVAGKRPWQGFLATFMGTPAPASTVNAVTVKASAVTPRAKTAPGVAALAASAAPAVAEEAPVQTQPTAIRPASSQPVAKALRIAKATDAPASNALDQTPSPSVATKASAEAALAPEPSGAAKLFAEANQARRAGQLGRASGLYHLLQEQYPGSSEAELSRVTLATLLLNGGDASGALDGFERYLAGASRALEAEALVGRARALQRLGRRQLETAAWREVTVRCPGSVYARQATERLAVLVPP